MARRSRQIDKDLMRRKSYFGRRAMMLGGVQAAGLGALGYRYYTLQIREHEKHRAVAEDNRLRNQILEPKRGEIIDRFGEKLAENQNGFQVNFRPQNNGGDSLTLVKLFDLLRLNDQEISDFTQRLVSQKELRTVNVVENVDRDTAVAVDSEALNLPGVEVVERDTRIYPFGALAAHVVGYVRNADENDLERDQDDLLRLPGFKVGQVGVEGTMDRTLRGRAGLIQNEIDAHGNRQREVKRNLPQAGRDLELTIDVGLHHSIYERLDQDENVSAGAVVVMNVHTGEVLASVSYPTYDPNGFIGRVDPTWYRQVNENTLRPQFNRVLVAGYPPASTYKMIPMLAALESGQFSTRHRVTCDGFINIATFGGESSRKFRCWKRSGHGTLTMPSALKSSCDVYLYQLVVDEEEGLGVNGHEQTIEMAQQFGLGQSVCMDLVGENKGTLPTDDYKQLTFGDVLRTGDKINASIGQGFWTSTPLQLTTMTSRLVNGGYAVRPYYIQPNVPYDWPRMRVSADNLDRLKDAMEQVTMDERGTAYKARIRTPGLEMAGKTGTAQVKALARGDAEAEECFLTEYQDRDHSLFVGYAPIDRPRYACTVIIEHGCGGSQTAAPIARDILTVAQLRNSSALGVTMPERPSLREITEERERAEQALVDREARELEAFARAQQNLTQSESVEGAEAVVVTDGGG